MATVYFMDGFDQYPALENLVAHWVVIPPSGTFSTQSLSSTSRHVGGKSIYSKYAGIYCHDFSGLSTLTLSFAMKFTDSAPLGGEIRLEETGVATHLTLKSDSNFYIHCYRGATDLGLVSNTQMKQNVWAFFEWKVVIDDNIGEIQLKMDGRTVINATGLDTREGGSGEITRVMFLSTADRAEMYIDDVFISDDFIGDRHVACYSPAADTTQADWTPLSAGDNYAEVDDCPHDSDTSYNETSTDAHKDRFTIETLPSEVIGVDAVQVEAWAKLVEAGSSTISPVIKSGTTETVETGQGLQTTYQPVTSAIYNTDPNTSAAWTKSNAQAIEIGYKFNEVV